MHHEPAAFSVSDSSIEEAAIHLILLRWEEAWTRRDAALGASDYSNDADWMNPWGNRLKGKAEIQQFLKRMYADPNIVYRSTTVIGKTVRFIRPDIAVVFTSFEVIGQRASSGREIPKRHGHSCRVVVKEGGRWSIVSHFFMDQNKSLRSL